MKKITLLLSFFLFVALGLSAQATYTEEFTTANIGASYVNGTYTGVNDIEWTYVHARDEGDYAIEGGGVMLRRVDESSSLSATFTNGISEFSFQYRKAYTAAKTRTYKVDVTNNGVTTTYDIPDFGGGSGAQTNVETFSKTALNLTGEVTIKIYASGSKGNQQATFDNFSWTEYAGTTDPTITVTSPEAGDSWEHGSNHNITWTYANIASTATVNINLYKNDVLTESLATGVTINDGSWTWNNISSSIVAGSDYKIKIEEATSPATGTSGVFSITAPIPTITVSAPAAGAYFGSGSQEVIEFTTANLTGTTVKIEYTIAASTAPDWQLVATGVALTASPYTWNVPANIANNDCQIRITEEGVATPTVGTSGTFNIVESVADLATLRTKTQGNVYKYTGTALVTYKVFNGYRNQMYIQDATAAILIDDNIQGTGSFDPGVITTPYAAGDGMTGLKGKLNEFGNMLQFQPVVDPGAPVTAGFTIDPQVVTIAQLTTNFDDYEAKLIKLENVNFSNPTGNFADGKTYSIADNNTPAGTFDFRTTFYGVDYIGTAIPSAAMDMVAIPNATSAGNFVTSRNQADFIISSDPFFNVTAPAAGDSWQQGTTHAITWDYANITATSVDILLYKGGVYSKDLKLNEPIGNKSWNWNIPADQTIGNDYTVVIAAGGTTEYSSGQFSIIAPIPVPKIFISEYTEGAQGNNTKAIEIYNGTGGTIDLSKLTVEQYNSGTSGQIYTLDGFTGNLAAGDVYTICNLAASADIKKYCDLSTNNSVMSFNGDDALVIKYDGVICDVFGDISTTPPTTGPWTVGTGTTKDQTLLRKPNITQGNTTNQGSFINEEWEIMADDYYSNIGGFGAVLTQDAVTGDITYDIPVSDYTKYSIILNQNTLNVTANLEAIDNIVVKSAGETTFTIKPDGHLKVAGNLFCKTPNTDPASTTATAAFNIESGEVGTSVKTGTLIHNFTASGNIQRYITGDEGAANVNATKYHGVSVPLVSSANPQSGLFMGSYLYRYSEVDGEWKGMGPDIGNPLNVKEGYLIYYPGANTTYNFAGTFNHGEFTIPYTSSCANLNYKGFNFIPNPYPSNIKFSDINIPANLTNGFWVWSAETGNYWAYNDAVGTGTTPLGSDLISIGQAFFVRASGSGTLTLNNDCRKGGYISFYGTGNQPNTLRITANGNQLQDEILFVFDNQWNLGSDEGDMLKMYGSEEAPQLSSINEDNKKLTLNTLPLNRYETIIPLSFTLNASTQVEFVADNSSLQSDITPFLVDKKANRTVNLRQNPVYTFNHENTDSDNRFELKFVNAVYSTPFDLVDENVIYVNSNNQLVISVPSMQNTKTLINVYDMQGKLVSSNSLFLTDTFVTEAPFVPGIYMVSVSNSTQAVNKKIVVTR